MGGAGAGDSDAPTTAATATASTSPLSARELVEIQLLRGDSEDLPEQLADQDTGSHIEPINHPSWPLGPSP